jgi:hypothetical protein
VWSIAEVAIGGLNLKESFYRAIPACLTSAWSSITNCHSSGIYEENEKYF